MKVNTLDAGSVSAQAFSPHKSFDLATKDMLHGKLAPLDYKLGWPICTRPCFQVERCDMMSAYYRRLTGDDEDVKLKCARSWSNWEMSTARLLEDKDMLKRTESDTFALQFARIEW